MSFRGFLEILKEKGKLKEINEPLSPVYEVSSMVGNEPTLFTDVNGSKVVMNILASRDLLAAALGVAPDKIIEHLSSCPPEGEVKLVRDSHAMEVVDEPDLYK